MGHTLVVKLHTVFTGTGALIAIEVEHPTGIGPQLIITAIEAVAQHELTTRKAFVADDDALALGHEPVG